MLIVGEEGGATVGGVGDFDGAVDEAGGVGFGFEWADAHFGVEKFYQRQAIDVASVYDAACEDAIKGFWCCHWGRFVALRDAACGGKVGWAL